MKILYGVQTTGNGHISRSREVIRHLKELGADVHVILSGRDPKKLWDMEIFAPYTAFRGLTFVTVNGTVDYIRTGLNLNFFRFFKDIRSFDARGFDLVITDFEPISARIARRCKVPSMGVGHQYAFYYDIPMAGADLMSMFVLKNFADTDVRAGLHWHHFGQPVLPPIVPGHLAADRDVIDNKVLVYLPFENYSRTIAALRPCADYDFFIYGPFAAPEDDGNIRLRPFSRQGFLDDLKECAGVISNAGFELASEAIHLGKKLLVKPLVRQMEQTSNALAITRLNLGAVAEEVAPGAVAAWLDAPSGARIRFPNVARYIAEQVIAGQWRDVSKMADDLWRETGQSAD